MEGVAADLAGGARQGEDITQPFLPTGRLGWLSIPGIRSIILIGDLTMLTGDITGGIIPGGGLPGLIARGGTIIAGLSGRGLFTGITVALKFRSSCLRRVILGKKSFTSRLRPCPTCSGNQTLCRTALRRLREIPL
jgi:hypothetical protein